ncbi:MAG: hypothetical protein JSS02_26055 [Planctomycetes bacterium]|nr:hypothetical protein [Planctomycetota bacterium]
MESFDTCMEWAVGIKNWVRQSFGPIELRNEAVSAGKRLWIAEVLASPFPTTTPTDAAWFCRLLSSAADLWQSAYSPTTAELRYYEDADILRLAWPIIQGGPFRTDDVTEPEAQRRWQRLSPANQQTFEHGFPEFLRSERLKTWQAFIQKIDGTTGTPPQPPPVAWATFTTHVVDRVAPLLDRLDTSTDWHQHLGTRWNLTRFLDVVAGRLFAITEWPRPETPDVPRIIHHSDNIFSIANHPQTALSDNEANVLITFVDRPTQTLTQLTRYSGVDDAARILTALKKRYDGIFAPAIHLPGGKGKGGYRVAITSVAPQKRQ